MDGEDRQSIYSTLDRTSPLLRWRSNASIASEGEAVRRVQLAEVATGWIPSSSVPAQPICPSPMDSFLASRRRLMEVLQAACPQALTCTIRSSPCRIVWLPRRFRGSDLRTCRRVGPTNLCWHPSNRNTWFPEHCYSRPPMRNSVRSASPASSQLDGASHRDWARHVLTM